MATKTSPNIGDTVTYRQRLHIVTAVRLGLIAGPHVRLSPIVNCAPHCDCAELTSVGLVISC